MNKEKFSSSTSAFNQEKALNDEHMNKHNDDK